MANLARQGSQSPKVKSYANHIGFDRLDYALRPSFYYREEFEEIVRTPEFMLNDWETLGYIEGDCDDISTLVASMTKSLGYATRLTAIQSSDPLEYDHVFTEVRIGSNWLPIDLTVPVGTQYQAYGYMSEMI